MIHPAIEKHRDKSSVSSRSSASPASKFSARPSLMTSTLVEVTSTSLSNTRKGMTRGIGVRTIKNSKIG